jgi:hypothetical protein
MWFIIAPIIGCIIGIAFITASSWFRCTSLRLRAAGASVVADALIAMA